jgi:hypothetical protein
VTDIQSSLAGKSRQNTVEFIKLSEDVLPRTVVRGLKGVDYEVRLKADEALRALSLMSFNEATAVTIFTSKGPGLVFSGSRVSEEEVRWLGPLLSAAEDSLCSTLRERDVIRENLEAAKARVAEPSSSNLLDIQRAEENSALVIKLSRKLDEIESQADRDDDLILLTKQVVERGNWPILTPARKGLELRVEKGTETSLPPVQGVPPGAASAFNALKELLIKVGTSDVNTKWSRVFIQAPEAAWDKEARRVRPMPDAVFEAWKAQQSALVAPVDRDISLEAWMHLVESWNRRFPTLAVVIHPSLPRRARSVDRARRLSDGVLDSRIDPVLVAECRALKSQVAALLAERDAALAQIKTFKANPCGLCNHCWHGPSDSLPLRQGKKPESFKEILVSPDPVTKAPMEALASASSVPFQLKLNRKMKASAAKAAETVKSVSEGPVDPPEAVLPDPAFFKTPPSVSLGKGKGKAVVLSATESPDPFLLQKKEARKILGLEHKDSVDGLTKAERDSYYNESRLPKWVIRGLETSSKQFLKDLQGGKVNAESFNDWFVSHTRPDRAELTRRWTSVKAKYAGTKLVKRPKSEQEQKFHGDYLRLLALCRKCGEEGIVPKDLPDPIRSRTSSRGRSPGRVQGSGYRVKEALAPLTTNPVPLEPPIAPISAPPPEPAAQRPSSDEFLRELARVLAGFLGESTK